MVFDDILVRQNNDFCGEQVNIRRSSLVY